VRRTLVTTLAALSLLPVIGNAEERTVTLAVEKMDCAACPYIVREAMAAASADAGFPARRADAGD